MREIKFQAWHKQEKKMYKVNYLHFTPNGDLFGVLVKDGQLLSIGDFELREFTGFKDCKGQKIYEGDILLYPYAITLVDQHVWPHKEIAVSASDHKLEVQWEDGSFILACSADGRRILLGVANIKEMEVIGNIYEHPELVREEDGSQ